MANNKKSFVLRIDKDILEAVEKWAADEFRSTNGQLEWLIVNALRREKRYKRKIPENDRNEAGSEK